MLIKYLLCRCAIELKVFLNEQIHTFAMTHHDAVGVERAEPARREDCGCGWRGVVATIRRQRAVPFSPLPCKLGRTFVGLVCACLSMQTDASR